MEDFEQEWEAGDGRLEAGDKIWKKGFLSGMVTALFLLAALLGGAFWGFWKGGFRESLLADLANVRKMIALEQYVDRYYLDEKNQTLMAEGMYKGMIAGLGDVYSRYYTEEEYRAIHEENTGEYIGIGILMQKKENGSIVVAQCYEESPCEKAGIQAGDCIWEVNGEDVTKLELTEISAMVKNSGEEYLTLLIEREGETERQEYKVLVGTVEYETVSEELLENQIGYLSITDFKSVTSQQFEKALERLWDAGMTSLIVDLRGNPGGLLTSVCDVLRQILPEGIIMYTEDKNGKREEQYCEGNCPLSIPLVVLIDENSASAAEIFAGAVQDYGIGVLVGKTTYGKGVVQALHEFTDGSAVKLTISRYYTPKGNNIDQTGVAPDYEIEAGNNEKDLQLEEAIRLAEKAVADIAY